MLHLDQEHWDLRPQDASASSSNLRFVDLDLDEQQIGGTLSFEPPERADLAGGLGLFFWGGGLGDLCGRF